MVKKLEGIDAQQFQRLVTEENTIVFVNGIPYLIARLPLLNEVGFEIESDSILKASINRAKQDIKAGRIYSTEDAIEMLERGELER